MTTLPLKRILVAIPLNYGPDWGFWTREAGLTALTLREMGYDAWLVALGDPAATTSDPPVLPISRKSMESGEWWQSQKPDAVIFYGWSAPRFDAIRKAALVATPRVVERLDTDGARSARLFPRHYFIRFTSAIASGMPRPIRWISPILAGVRTGFLYLFPRFMDVWMVKTMGQLPAVIAESPVAAARIQQMFETFAGEKHRVAMIPTPVNENTLHYDGLPKENQVITVGRWGTLQKDFPKLMKVLKGFLQCHPDWYATVVGGGVPARYKAGHDSGEEWRKRVIFHEKMTHEELMKQYNRSKIYLMVSRCEGFNTAAAEALCCGCSVVSARVLATSTFMAEENSGAVAETRSTEDFLKTLDEEVGCWANGKRKPEAIASLWRERLGSHAVARATLALFEEIVPSGAPEQ